MTTLKIIIGNMKCNKIKYIITILSVIISIGSVLLISIMSSTGKNLMELKLKESGVNSLFVKSSFVDLVYKDILTLKSNFDQISKISPFMPEKGRIDVRGEKKDAILWGANEDTGNLVGTKTIYGRDLNKNDVIQNLNVCVIDKKLAFNMYGRENVIGKNIDILIGETTISFEVVGVMDVSNNIMHMVISDYLENFIYIPFSTMKEKGNYKSFTSIAFSLKDNNLNITKDIEKLMSLDKNDNIKVSNFVEGLDIVNDIFALSTSVLTLIALISVFVSGLMIMMVMVTSVKERTLEIGIKKALGAKQQDILKEFILEALLISIVGFVISFIFVCSFLYLILMQFNVALVLDFKFIINIFLITLSIGVIFSSYPSYKASKLSPAEAFRK
ncbi:MAG: ABC transporter permease [Oscillospiraceae bacterium]